MGGVIVSAILMASAAAVGWLAFQHIPEWYDPPRLTAADMPGVRASLPSVYQAFTDQLAGGGEFEFRLSARTVNNWIAARADLWPDSRELTPPWIKEPVVAFTGGRVVLGARYERDDWRVIVSAHFEVVPTGDTLVIRLVKPAAGSLPLPLALIGDALDEHLADLLGNDGALPVKSNGLPTGMERLESVRTLLDGWELENRMYWSNGERYFRIGEAHAENGWLVLKVETL